MSGMQRKKEQAALEIEQIRHALGVVAMAEPAVFWIYLGADGMWRSRREGDALERHYASRGATRAFVEVLAARCSAYRLFVQGEDGAFIEESAGWPAKLRRLIAGNERESNDLD
jgi:hypothetical protein